MKNPLSLLFFLVLQLCLPLAMAQTDVSLFYKKGTGEQIDYVESKKGNLFSKLGHHGPAIENPWYGLRIYFHKKAAIDVYSKAEPKMELREKEWYPSAADQRSGWGADYYKVGNTIGLGGIKLWDGEHIIDLHPVRLRTARVYHYGDSASIEMQSLGVPYMKSEVDICVRLTVYSDNRKSRVEVSCEEDVRFVSGINYFKDLELVKNDRYIATWGQHPEDVAAEKISVGAAIFLPKEDSYEIIQDRKQFLLLTEPTNKFSIEITSASQREDAFQSMEDFTALLDKLVNQ